MIDVHCHLEQSDYDKDLEEVLSRCREKLDAVIVSAPDPDDHQKAVGMSRSHPGFVFCTLGIHPQYVEKYSDEEIESVFETIRSMKDSIVGIGETGLDYSHITDLEGRERQKSLFARSIRLAKELDLSVLVHIRNGKDEADAFDDALSILEKENAERVHLHMFGSRKLLPRAMEDGYYISANAIILSSKSYSKVVRNVPIDRLMLETDAPWLHPSGKPKHEERNEPANVLDVAKKVAEIKGISVEEVDKITTRNAIEFFRLGKRLSQLEP